MYKYNTLSTTVVVNTDTQFLETLSLAKIYRPNITTTV